MANAFKCDVCGKYYKEHTVDLKNISINILGISNISGADLFLTKEDLCPECYEKIRQVLNPKVENVQPEYNTDCFEKEMTQEEALKLMQETWCWKCKFFNKVVCMKKIKNLDESCFYDFMNNEVPRNFKELPIPIQEFENGGNENEN